MMKEIAHSLRHSALHPTSAVYAVAGIHSFMLSGYPKDTVKHQHLQTHCPAIEYHSLLWSVFIHFY
jgi:hypothetical protein